MPYVRHGIDIKRRAVDLFGSPELSEHVWDVLGVSRASVFRWKRNLELYGSVDKPVSGKRGRPTILTSGDMDDVRDLILTRADYYLKEIHEWLRIAKDIPVSRSTVHKCIVDAGFSYKMLRLRARLRNEQEIDLFKSLVRNTIRAEHIMATDETSKDGRTLYRRRGYVPKGQEATVQNDVDRGERWTLLPAMSTRGYEAKRVVEGNVDTLEFNDFILEQVLPLMNPWPQPRSVLLLDNCRIHKSQLVEAAVREKGCLVFFIPPYAPELNPIEESFSCIKAVLRRNYVLYSEMDPDVALEAACTAITPEKAEAWIKHAGYL